jgi:hypothetical protein
MTNPWTLSALWVGLALFATLLAIWFKVSTALSEIVVGTVPAPLDCHSRANRLCRPSSLILRGPESLSAMSRAWHCD